MSTRLGSTTKLDFQRKVPKPHLQLVDGARIAVIGGGPAGSFFSFFALGMAERVMLDIHIDVYEPRSFTTPGPVGCNMCGGIISESLVQTLAAEGIVFPPLVVQRGIDSYKLHMDVGSVRIVTPNEEKRIGSVYRGMGPRDLKNPRHISFDGFLLGMASAQGAEVIPHKVEEIRRENGKPQIVCKGKDPVTYDLVVVAAGVNAGGLKLLQQFGDGYEAPGTTKTFIREYRFGRERTKEVLGSSMHVFLLNIPRLEFGAVIPKGDYVSICLLGEDVDAKLIKSFLDSNEVKACMPPEWESEISSCKCSPRMNVRGAARPYGDRLVFIGDSGVTRLYKDGIGAAYRTAKAAATTAIIQGVADADFERHYWPACRRIADDNRIGHLIFVFMRLIQKYRFARRAVRRMVSYEQADPARPPRMSSVLWDMFTGSAPYREIFKRTLHPAFWLRLIWYLVSPFESRDKRGETAGSDPGTRKG